LLALQLRAISGGATSAWLALKERVDRHPFDLEADVTDRIQTETLSIAAYFFFEVGRRR
jgi:hypothetical protein